MTISGARSVLTTKKKVRLIVFGFFCFAPAAYGYIDPGSGLLLIQGFLAFIGGIVVFVKDPIGGLKRLLRRFRKDKNA